MKGYIINGNCYIFPQQAGEIPEVEANAFYVQEEDYVKWVEENEQLADKIKKYNYNIITKLAKVWAGHTNDDLEPPVVLYDITYSGDTTHVTGPATAEAGDTITITPTTAAEFNDITLTSSDATITKNAENWTFTMPEADVAVGVAYNPVHDYSKDYLTFTALEDTTFTSTTNALQYSLDDGTTWDTLAANTASPTVTESNKIIWKASLTPAQNSGIGTFSATGNFEASGNIMSLLYGDNFIGQTDLTGKSYAFYNLFNSNDKLVNAENLILPATTLVNQCYSSMFSGCTSLTTAPELPATTLAEDCYSFMFNDCTSLTTAPELPATTLANYCYNNMFNGCTSLATAPELPATTLADNCYGNMFESCTALTTAPELPATTLASECYNSIFSGCTSLNYIKCLATDITASDCTTDWVNNVSATGTFVKDPSMTDWSTGYDGIPSGWTIEDAPA